jgi:hypothetical protein
VTQRFDTRPSGAFFVRKAFDGKHPQSYNNPSAIDLTTNSETSMFDSRGYEAWLYSGTVVMPLREYLAQVLSQHEPGVIFEECVHDFTDDELAQVINIDDSGYSTNLDDELVHTRHLWSPMRVYFVCDDDGRCHVQSAPRNPG